MADKGFDIQDDFAAKGVTVNIPSFLKGKTQFSKEEMAHNKRIASLRIHVTFHAKTYTNAFPLNGLDR